MTSADPALRPISSFEPKAVLFDFDGVIVNSEPLHFRAFRDTLAEDGIDLTEAEYFAHLIGFDDAGVFRRAFELKGIAVDRERFIRVIKDKARRMMEAIHRGEFAAAGVSDLVRGLHRHYPLAICSGARRDEIETILDTIGLRDCFPTIVAAEDVRVGKPDPSGYLLTASLVGQSPIDCLVIEDAPSVIRNVKARGFKTLGIAGSHSLADLAEADQAITQLNVEQFCTAFPGIKLDRD